MYPVLFRIGHFEVSTYGVILLIAVFLGGLVLERRFREQDLPGGWAWDLVVLALLGGIVGAKVYYVLLHGDPSAFLSRGGLVWYGGFIGGAAAVGFLAWRRKLSLGVVGDALAPAAALGHGIGHFGCFFSGDSYGLPSTLPWAVAFPKGAPPSTAGVLRSEFGVSLPASIPNDMLLRVHPTMLYSALALLAVAALLWAVRNHGRRAGWLFGLYLTLSGSQRFLIEFLRAKDDRFLWGLTTAQAIALLLVLAGAALLLALRQRPALESATAGGAGGARGNAPHGAPRAGAPHTG